MYSIVNALDFVEIVTKQLKMGKQKSKKTLFLINIFGENFGSQ